MLSLQQGDGPLRRPTHSARDTRRPFVQRLRAAPYVLPTPSVTKQPSGRPGQQCWSSFLPPLLYLMMAPKRTSSDAGGSDVPTKPHSASFQWKVCVWGGGAWYSQGPVPTTESTGLVFPAGKGTAVPQNTDCGRCSP